MKIRTRCPLCGCLNIGVCECSRREGRRRTDETRGTSSERGYGADWRKFRDTVLNDTPLCEDCHQLGVTTPATEVHHIIKVRDRFDLRLVRSNVMALCKSCHSKRTVRGE